MLNIAAKQGIEALGVNYDQYIYHLLHEASSSDETDVEDTDDEAMPGTCIAEYDSILKRIRKIVLNVKDSPQKRVIFEQTNKAFSFSLATYCDIIIP